MQSTSNALATMFLISSALESGTQSSHVLLSEKIPSDNTFASLRIISTLV
jgi:hypothetical protein